MSGVCIGRKGPGSMNKLAMLDRKLLEMLQNDFPLTPDPFYDLAEALETDVDEIGEESND
jgi:DNA-binding Lrp family transcriptional regulator